MHDVTNRSRVDVEAVAQRARALIALFAQVLESIGASRAARALPLQANTSAEGYDHDALLAATVALHLMSVVEQCESRRHRAEAERRGETESGLFLSTLGRLKPMPHLRTLERALGEVYVQPVFTAHPTEARRVSTLEQYRELMDLLARAPSLETLHEGERALLEAALERLFRSGEVRVRKPEVQDEQNVVIGFVTRALPAALADLERRLDEAWRDAGLPPRTGPGPQLRFGTWVGGDRDGHPLVTPEVTRAALLSYRGAALSMHRAALVRLAARLGFSGLHRPSVPELEAGIAKLAALLAQRAEAPLARNPEEPFRTFVNLMLARLPEAHARNLQAGDYRSADELLEDLELLSSALRAVSAHRLERVEVAPLVRNVRVFGFHLVSLDVRQNSQAHDLAVEGLLALSGEADTHFSGWSEDARLAFLARELESRRPFVSERTPLPAAAESAVGALRVLAGWLDAHGPSGLGTLIVSMTRSVSDLLVPHLLAREAGLLRATEEGPVHPVGSSRVDLQACKLEYSIVSPK